MQLYGAPSAVFLHVLGNVNVGASSCGTDVTRLALDTIAAVAGEHMKQVRPGASSWLLQV